jgi:hypothetical protein
MKIQEAKDILIQEQFSKKTVKWKGLQRDLTEYALECISATLQDQKNYNQDVVQCKGCGFVISSLLTTDGCPNCGVDDLSLEIKKDQGENK